MVGWPSMKLTESLGDQPQNEVRIQHSQSLPAHKPANTKPVRCQTAQASSSRASWQGVQRRMVIATALLEMWARKAATTSVILHIGPIPASHTASTREKRFCVPMRQMLTRLLSAHGNGTDVTGLAQQSMAVGDHIEDTSVRCLPTPQRPMRGQVPQEL
jgi:hypothetical protein